MMDLKNLKKSYPMLISFMETNGYSKEYIRKFQFEISFILREGETPKWRSYDDVYLSYVEQDVPKFVLKTKRIIIRAIERFDLNGMLPGRFQPKVLSNGKYDLLCDEFKGIINFYRRLTISSEKKSSVINQEIFIVTSFLLFLQEKKVFSLESVKEADVVNFFIKGGKTIKCYTYRAKIAMVLKACVSHISERICFRILSYIPNIKQTRKNIQYLTENEIVSIKAALTKVDSTLSLRDKAIGLLAFYLGLRNSDIAGLTFADIDWALDRIHIRQQKTGIPIEFPLNASIGNAIYDYIINERPSTKCQSIFVSKVPPFIRLDNNSMYYISKVIMKVANVRLTHGDRMGFHLFRHHLATSMLSKGVPGPIISQTLGHTSPSSIEPYLSADFTHLKTCALSIEHFPIRKEVLA